MSGVTINTAISKTIVTVTDAGYHVNVATPNGNHTQVNINGGVPLPFPVMGPQGPQGIQGPQGVQGIQGIPGAQGNPTTINGKTGASITLDKADIGLADVDNTSDADKPVSTAVQTALDAKQGTLGFTPEDVALKQNSLASPDSSHYTTTQAVAAAIATKADLVGGKVPLSQINDALIGNVQYKGLYSFATGIITSSDAALNGQPLPASSPANTGWYFIVQDDGTVNAINFVTGDWIISNSIAGWHKVDNTDAVSSVNGYTGNVSLSKADVGLSNVVNTDTTNPANIITNTTHRFVADSDITVWNAKQDALTQGNGITIATNAVAWGGTLTAPVAINANGNDIAVGQFTVASDGNLSTIRPQSGVQMLSLFPGGFIVKNGNSGAVMLNLQSSALTIPQLASASASPYITVDASGNLASANLTFAALQSTPTTLSGYGITDAYPLTGNPSGFLSTEADPVYTANGVSLAGTQTISGVKTFSSLLTVNNSLAMGASLSAAQWGANGIGLVVNAATYTDTTSTGTVTANYLHVINAPTLIASAATTYTNAATLYIAAAPIASTNVTITNNYALRAGGPVLVEGVLQANSALYSGTSSTNSNLVVASNTNAASTTTTQYLPVNAGATISSIYRRTSFYGNGLTTLATGASYGSVIFGNTPIKEAASGTHTLLANIIVRPLAVTDAAATTTNTASLFIDGAASATVTGNNYAMWVAAGLSKFDGGLQFAFSTKSSDPSTTDIAAGMGMVYKNTTTNTVKLWVNDGGTMKSVPLS